VLILFFRDAQAAGFAVFGTFAHLVMTNYDLQWKKRLGQLVTLTFSGAVMIAWGTAASMWLWLAVLSACAWGFVAGQAAFTLFVVVLLSALTPLGFRAGILRLEDIAIGGAISLVLGAVYPAHRGHGHVSGR
jgi:hypothetical protein